MHEFSQFLYRKYADFEKSDLEHNKTGKMSLPYPVRNGANIFLPQYQTTFDDFSVGGSRAGDPFIEPTQKVIDSIASHNEAVVFQKQGASALPHISENGVVTGHLGEFFRNLGRPPHEVQAEKYAKQLQREAEEERLREEKEITESRERVNKGVPQYRYEKREDVNKATTRAEEIMDTYGFSWTRAYVLSLKEQGFKIEYNDQEVLEGLESDPRTQKRLRAYEKELRKNKEESGSSTSEEPRESQKKGNWFWGGGNSSDDDTSSSQPDLNLSRSDQSYFDRIKELCDNDPDALRRVIESNGEDPGKYGL